MVSTTRRSWLVIRSERWSSTTVKTSDVFVDQRVRTWYLFTASHYSTKMKEESMVHINLFIQPVHFNGVHVHSLSGSVKK